MQINLFYYCPFGNISHDLMIKWREKKTQQQHKQIAVSMRSFLLSSSSSFVQYFFFFILILSELRSSSCFPLNLNLSNEAETKL